MKQVRILLSLLLIFALLTGAAGAAGSGTLTAGDALNVKQGENGTVSISLANNFSPKVAGLTFRVTYNSSVAQVNTSDDFTLNDLEGFLTPPSAVTSPITLAGAKSAGISNGAPWLVNITFSAMKNDGSETPIGLELVTARDTALPPADLKGAITIVNGTFSTRDEVAPVITITTPTTVSQTFAVTGTVTDVGGMGTAIAYLDNGTANVTVPLTLALVSPNTWSFNTPTTWPVEVVTLKVSATDLANNTGSANKLVDVKEVGFLYPEPTGFINAQPTVIKVFTQQIDPATVTMTLSGPAMIPLGVTFDGAYAQNATVPALVDGTWTVNATGTDTVGGESRSLEWTFTLDRVPPVITSFTITDTDGDGYIEAGEQLNFNWNVAGADRVEIKDNTTQTVFFTSTAAAGSDSVTVPVGNRAMVFAAFDNAGNVAYVPFHLYYNYMAWVNSTRTGTVSGIDMNLTAMRQIDLAAQGSVTFYNAREAPLPPFGTIVRSVTHVGQVTADTFVAVDNTANRTYTGAQTYNKLWTYNPSSVLDFQVQAPNINGANLLILEANESYLARMIDEGRAASSVNYNDLFKKSAWFFINGGYTQIVVNPDGTFSQPVAVGTSLNVSASGKIMDTLALPANQVNLTTGYRLSTQALPALTFPAGDYVLAAISVDNDRIGIIEVLPFTVMNMNEVGTVPASVTLGTSFDVSFTTPARRVAAVMVRHDTWDAQAGIDASTIGPNMISANLTYGGIPATQKLAGNIYTSPNSAKYAAAQNTTTVTVGTSGLLAGTYDVHLLAEHVNGTIQAYGHHQIVVAPTPTPTPTPRPSGGGGGGSSVSTTTSTGSADLLTASWGGVLKPYQINSDEGTANLFLATGVTALLGDGKTPVSEITIADLESDEVPATPSGATFSFLGYAVECSPAGATFSPAIDLTFTLTAEEWAEVMEKVGGKAENLVVKWYNPSTGEWESVPTTVDTVHHTVTASITHFSTYGLFSDSTIVTPVTTEPTTPTTTAPATTTTTPATPSDEGGFPWLWVIVIIVIIAVAAGAYIYMQRQ